ncbi:hypothetical protein NDK50_24295 [Paraburkholderia bryophila]|uniref:hypothetical protein n=1 Tax=Paraburkholderia bryophila TaxID=420952 RepID=UPI00234B419B|nr:hypothetical protein [Paraburkholderia bryophila]WCM23966.1 hypothetical protein NDK50_24295 [Paraburkholderia bryophila]
MTVDELLAEGERLCRPCFWLNVEGEGNVVGYWQGERADRPNAVPPEATALRSIKHILTIDSGLLKRVGLSMRSSTVGFTEVESAHGDTHYRVFESDAPISDLRCDGLPLHAAEGRSFPPFEAVCLYGGESVADWLKSLGLERHEYGWAESAPEAVGYFDAYAARSPIYRHDADLVVGGWHQCWPEDNFYMPLEMRLAVLTLRDSEPWYELWQAIGRGGWSVKARIT